MAQLLQQENSSFKNMNLVDSGKNSTHFDIASPNSSSLSKENDHHKSASQEYPKEEVKEIDINHSNLDELIIPNIEIN